MDDILGRAGGEKFRRVLKDKDSKAARWLSNPIVSLDEISGRQDDFRERQSGLQQKSSLDRFLDWTI